MLLIVSVSACLPTGREEKEKKSTEWKTITSDNFTLRVPAHLKEATELHEDAVVQLQNPIKEFYTIVIEESQEEFHNALITGGLQDDFHTNLEGYSTLVGEKFSDNIDEMISKSEYKPLIVNGDSATYFEAEAKVSGMKIYYHYGFVRGDSSYYQVMSWTLASKKEKLHADMVEILSSFKEK
jgi:hypothetical protein